MFDLFKVDTNRLNNVVLFPLRKILWSAVSLKNDSTMGFCLERILVIGALAEGTLPPGIFLYLVDQNILTERTTVISKLANSICSGWFDLRKLNK